MLGCQSAVCIRHCHLANLSILQRQATTMSYSRSCNYLWMLLFALSITQCKPFSPQSLRSQIHNSLGQFDGNLNHLLADLAANTPQTGYNASSYGQFPNEVAGFIQCRGDASQAECHDCCQSIIKDQTATSNDIEWYTWYDMCELVYLNLSSPLSPNDDYDLKSSCNGSVKIKDPKGLQTLLYNLSDEASIFDKKFAKGSAVDSTGQKIYGLVQCFMELSASNCSYCLSQAFLQLDALHLGFGTHIFMGTCYFIISNEPTYSNSTCTGGLTGSHSRKLLPNLGILGSVLVALASILL